MPTPNSTAIFSDSLIAIFQVLQLSSIKTITFHVYILSAYYLNYAVTMISIPAQVE